MSLQRIYIKTLLDLSSLSTRTKEEENIEYPNVKSRKKLFWVCDGNSALKERGYYTIAYFLGRTIFHILSSVSSILVTRARQINKGRPLKNNKS